MYRRVKLTSVFDTHSARDLIDRSTLVMSSVAWAIALRSTESKDTLASGMRDATDRLEECSCLGLFYYLLGSRFQGLTDDRGMEFEFKQVIVVRRDLDMGKGKIAVQVAHAAVSASEEARRKFREWWEPWLNEGQCKVAVRVDSVDEILELERRSRELRLPSALITDRGLTQIEPGTITCLGIGPAPSGLIDTLTGGLNLL